MEENQNPTQQLVPVISPTAPVSTPPTSNPPPIVKKSAKFSIKAIIGTIIFLLVAGGAAAGFMYREPILKLVSNPTPTPTVVISPTQDPTADWKSYLNDEIGISFTYPSDWGILNSYDVTCTSETEIGYNRIYNNEPCVEITLSAKNLTGRFFSAQSKQYAQHKPGLDAYWGDRFSVINESDNTTPEEFINSYCEGGTEKCTKQTNNNGVTYVKSLESEQVIQSDRKAYYYFVLNKNTNFPVLLLSSQALLDTMSLNDSEKILDKILSTFKFKK